MAKNFEPRVAKPEGNRTFDIAAEIFIRRISQTYRNGIVTETIASESIADAESFMAAWNASESKPSTEN